MLLFLHVLAIALGADWIPCYFYSMDGNSRHQVIKRLQAGLPRGAPFDLATLSQFGVSPQLAAHYADGGWLVRLAHGVYAFPNDEFGEIGRAACRASVGQYGSLTGVAVTVKKKKKQK